MNELVKRENNAVVERTIDDVAREVIELTEQAQTMMVCYVIEIGRRLREAKSMLGHGEWGDWLKTKVNYSQSTADNYMKIFDEYGNDQISFFGLAKSQTLGNLPYTKALKLLAVPSDEREEFIKENKVEDLSTRELDRLIEEKKQAEAERDKERQRADALASERADFESIKLQIKTKDSEIEALEAKLAKAEAEREKAKKQVKDLKENPHIPEDVINRIETEASDKARAAAAEKAEADAKAIKEQLEKIKAEKIEAENKAGQSTVRISELEKQIKMSSPEATAFKIHFDAAQKALATVAESLKGVSAVDIELGEKFKTALKALIKRYEEI